MDVGDLTGRSVRNMSVVGVESDKAPSRFREADNALDDGAGLLRATGGHDLRNAFEDICFDGVKDIGKEKGDIQEDALFKHINRIKNGGQDDFSLSVYLSELGFSGSENITVWVKTIGDAKRSLLTQCAPSEKDKALVEYYKVVFNILRRTLLDFEARYNLDENWHLYSKVQGITYLTFSDVTYAETCDNQFNVDEDRVQELMRAVKRIKEKYGCLPDAVLDGIPKDENGVRNCCGENYAPTMQEFYNDMEGQIKATIYQQFNVRGLSDRVSRLKQALGSHSLPYNVVEQIRIAFS
ncbi:hypothetical protein GCM10023116_26030 [Kistimonas scapharcae]|uniref:Uncharacterized protein n=2 Tax=Kistimonas scapharcae TaxID=1036133 RepID=A0ABP8V4Y3_9GAMM